MPQRLREYHIPLRQVGTVIYVRLLTDGRRKLAWTIQLETFDEGKWKPVIRYDTADGWPHRDTLDRRGQEIRKEWLSTDNLDETFDFALTDVKANWPNYLERYMRNFA